MANYLISQMRSWRDAIVAILVVAVAYPLRIIANYSGALLLLFSLLALSSYVSFHLLKIEKHKALAHSIFIFSVVAGVLSSGLYIIHRAGLSKERTNELLFQMTEDVVSDRVIGKPWITESALKADSICFIATTRWYDDPDGLRNIMHEIVDRKRLDDYARQWGELRFEAGRWDIAGNKYRIVIAERVVLKEVIPSGYIILPHSITLCALGMKRRENDWKAAEELFQQAHAEGNAYATYVLAQMNLSGFGRAKDDKEKDKEGMRLLKMAAEKGFLSAQYEWADRVLFDDQTSSADKALAEEFLVSATKMIDYRSAEGMLAFYNSIFDLNKYYNIRKDYVRAYLLTRRLSKSYKDYWLLKEFHIQNCLNLHLYSEARKLIRECEEVPREMVIKEGLQKVYLIHSRMYEDGAGFVKNLQMSESLLRYASDSLDYNLARKKLSEFYERQGFRDESAFFQKLYDADYSNILREK